MKHSIRLKLTLIFCVLIAGMCIMYVILNGIFLENYYISSKQDDLLEAYSDINDILREYEGNIDEDVRSNIYDICDKYGISMLVTGIDGREVVKTGNIAMLANRINSVFFERNPGEIKIIKETDEYVLQQYTNKRIENQPYLEMYGFLDNDASFIMRMGVESIRDSISVFNKFFVIISCVVIVIGIITMFFVAKRFSKPVLELADISKRMTNLDFGAKYIGTSSDEIGVLGHSMNEMSYKLEQTISELKKANNELQKDIQKRTEIDEMRKEFISNVSHELKTPLALISGYAEGLADCVNDDEESRNYYCEVIMDEANKMNKMVKQILSLNKLESGLEITEMEHFDICQVIDGIKQSFDIVFEQNGIKCELEMENNMMVWADEFRIEEVVSNYISNAINHCEGEKLIKISVKKLDYKVRVSVFNTGNIIPEDEIDKIWVKFYKIDKARSREYGGSGIGLSIVKAIMDSHNQNYGVCNTTDGVEFWFELDAKLS
ncbi:MAG: HAMP domain-containing protein [Lachnospiraceae bacterium]|nr:HAMP domain-containing protein [Lachnospiraceae bacterium]